MGLPVLGLAAVALLLAGFLPLPATPLHAQQLPLELDAHTAAVNAAIYSPDQRYVLTAGADQLIKIWDARTGEEVRTLAGHTGQVLSLAIRPDNGMLVSGAADNTIRTWDVPRPDPLRIFESADAAPRDVAVSPNGQWAVTFGMDKLGRVWLLGDGTETLRLEGMAEEPRVTAVRGDNNQIAAGDAGGSIGTWSPLDGQSQGTLGAHRGPVTGLAYHPNNQQLVSAGADGLLKVWQLPVAPSLPLSGHTAPVRAVAVAANGQLVVTGGEDSVRVFNVANGQALRELASAAGATRAVAVSPNSALVAAAGDRGVIQFWNLADGADRLRIEAASESIHSLAFHPDSSRIASAGQDGTIRLWRIPAPDVPLAGHASDVVAVAISGNGQLAATASADKTIRLWNATNGQPLRQLAGHEQPATDVAIRADGGQLASGDAGGDVRLWAAADGAAQGTLGAHSGALHGLAYSAAGDRLATVGEDAGLKIWRLPLAEARALAGPTAAVTAVAWSSDGKLSVTGGADKVVRFHDAASGQASRSLPAASEAITALALSADDALTATGIADGTIGLWNTADGTPWKGMPAGTAGAESASRLVGHAGAVRDVRFVPETRQVLSSGADGTVRLWNLPQAARLLAPTSGPISRIAVSPDGKRVAVAGTAQNQPAILVRDLASGEVTQTLLGHAGAVTALAFDRSGNRIVSGAADKTARLWDLRDPKFEQQKIDQPGPVTAVAFSDDGSHWFTATSDHVIRCWRPDQEPVVRELTGHGGAVASLTVAGTTLVSGAADGTARIWNWQTGAAVRTIQHGAAVTSLALTADGTLLATGGGDNQVKLWNVADGVSRGTLAGHAGPLVDLRFSTDSAHLASLSNDGIRLWDVPSGRLRELLVETAAEARGMGWSGQQLVLGRADGSLQIVSPRLVHLLEAHQGDVYAVAVSLDGKRAVSGGADKAVRLWNLVDGQPLATLAGAAEAVTGVALSADGKRAVASCRDKGLRAWALPAAASPQPVAADSQWELPAPLTAVSGIVSAGPSGVGSRIAVAGEDGVVRLWDLDAGRELERFQGHAGPVRDVAFSSDGTLLLSGGDDNSARLFPAHLESFVGLESPARDVAFTPDGARLVATVGNRLEVWRREAGAQGAGAWVLERQLPAANAVPAGFTATAPLALAVRPDGTHVAAVDAAGRVHVWNLADGNLVRSLPQDAELPPTPTPAPAQAGPDSQTAVAGSLAYSSDGSRLVIGSNRAVRVVAAADGRLLQRFSEDTPPRAVAIAADNRTLLVGRGGAQGNAVLRSVALEQLLESHPGGARHLSYLPNGQQLVSSGADKQLLLWNLAEAKAERRMELSGAEVLDLAISSDGQRLLAACGDKTVRDWSLAADALPADANSAVPPANIWPTSAMPRGVAISGDRTRWAWSGEGGGVHVHDLASGAGLQRFAGHQGVATDVQFGADNKTLVSAGEDQAGRVWSMNLLQWAAVDPAGITDLALAAAGAQALTAGEQGVQQWNLGNATLLRKFEPGDTDFVTVAARADNGQVAAADAQGNVLLWNLANGELVTSFRAPAAVRQLRYSPDNLKLAAACVDQQLRFFDPADGSLTYRLQSATDLERIAFTTDSRTVLSTGQRLQQWLYASPVAIRSVNAHANGVFGMAFSPDGRTLASCGADQTVRLWNPDTGAQLKQLSGHQGAVYSVSFSPDSALLVSCGADNSVRLWDTLGGRQLKQIPLGDGSLYAVAFFPDGKRVAAGGLERKIYLLDALSGQTDSTLDKHPDYLYRLSFNGQGTRMLSCGYGGNVMLWNAANGQLLWSEQLGRVANFADLAPDGSRVVVAGGDGKVRFLDVPPGAR